MPSLRADHQDDAGRAPRETAASFRGYRSRCFVPRGNSLGLSCRPNLLGGPQLEQSPLSMHPCEVRKPPEGGMHPFGGEVRHCRGRAHSVADSQFQWRAGSARQTLPPWHAPDGGRARTPPDRGVHPFGGDEAHITSGTRQLRPEIQRRTSSARHAVIPTESRIGAGNSPALTRRQRVDLENGTNRRSNRWRTKPV